MEMLSACSNQRLSGDQREPIYLEVFGGGGSGEETLLQKGPSPENSFSEEEPCEGSYCGSLLWI